MILAYRNLMGYMDYMIVLGKMKRACVNFFQPKALCGSMHPIMILYNYCINQTNCFYQMCIGFVVCMFALWLNLCATVAGTSEVTYT